MKITYTRPLHIRAETEHGAPLRRLMTSDGRIAFVPDLRCSDLSRFCCWRIERELAASSIEMSRIIDRHGHHDRHPA